MDSATFFESLLARSPDKLSVKRHEILTDYGERENHIYFIHEGAVCAFYSFEEEEKVIRFGYKGSIINALPSYFSGEPSRIQIKAIRSSIYTPISRRVLREFINEKRENHEIYRSLLEDLCLQQMERELDLLTSSPQERIDRVRKRSPQVFQEIPLKYIASYLRMSPETLSRLSGKS